MKHEGYEAPRNKGFLIVLFLSALFLLSCTVPPIPDAITPSFTSLPDAVYKGFYDGGIVKAETAVTLTGGRIISIAIVSHTGSPVGKKAESIVDQVVQAQSLDVDVVAGATYSSKVILKSIENALQG